MAYDVNVGSGFNPQAILQGWGFNMSEWLQLARERKQAQIAQTQAQTAAITADTKLSQDKFAEDTRRYNQNFGEEQRRYDQNFGEDQRRYNQDYQFKREQFADDQSYKSANLKLEEARLNLQKAQSEYNAALQMMNQSMSAGIGDRASNSFGIGRRR